jgi:hypothetical protein
MATEQEELSRSKSRRRARGGWPASNTIVRLMLEAAERARADANDHNDMGVGGRQEKSKCSTLGPRRRANEFKSKPIFDPPWNQFPRGRIATPTEAPILAAIQGHKKPARMRCSPSQVSRSIGRKNKPLVVTAGPSKLGTPLDFSVVFGPFGDVNLWSINQRFSPIDPVRNPP